MKTIENTVTSEEDSQLGLRWRIHLPKLIGEIIGSNDSMWIFRQPLNILRGKMVDLVEIAERIDDPELTDWICQLALIEQSDPADPKYNKELMDALAKEAQRLKRERTSLSRKARV